MFDKNSVLRQIFEVIGFPGYRSHREFEKDFEPSRFHDPIADQTEWTAIPASGSNIQTTKLVRKNANQLQFGPNILGKLLYYALIVVGAGVVFAATVFQYFPRLSPFDGPIDMAGYGAVCLVGIVVCLVGISLYSYYNNPVIFDRSRGFVRRATMLGSLFDGDRRRDQLIELRQIHALQIIPVHFSGTGGGRQFYNFQLNLVLTNAQRVPIVNYLSLDSLRKDASSISKLIERPLWDATRTKRDVGAYASSS